MDQDKIMEELDFLKAQMEDINKDWTVFLANLQRLINGLEENLNIWQRDNVPKDKLSISLSRELVWLNKLDELKKVELLFRDPAGVQGPFGRLVDNLKKFGFVPEKTRLISDIEIKTKDFLKYNKIESLKNRINILLK